MNAREMIERQVAAHEDQRRRDRERISRVSIDERARLIDSVCADAAAVLAGRRASGLPPYEPPDWPESTWNLLRKYAPNGTAQLTNQSCVASGR